MQYERPETVEDAVALLANAEGKAYVLAGGTDLLVQLRAGMVEPDLVVDIKNIDAARTISQDGSAYRIGAALSGAEAEEHPSLSHDWPGIVEALNLIGSTQIQGRATLGGNLCNASPAADSVPALVAANATCTIIGPSGEREVPVGDIPTGPGETSLGAGELVITINLPARPPHAADAYLRLIPRTEMDIAVVGAGVNVTLDDDGVCTDARVALGAVAPTVLLVPEAAKALIGTKGEEAALEAAAAAASAATRPIDDKRGTVEYRTHVAGVLTRRAAAIAFERAQQR